MRRETVVVIKQPWPTLATFLRDQRRGAGLTQRELAARAAVSVRTLRDIEHGRVERPHARSARRLAAALADAGADGNQLRIAVEAAAGGITVQVGVLGAVTVRHEGVPLEWHSLKLRSLLGLLAIRHDQAVSPGEIIEVLWDGRPPKTAEALIHTYVRYLRRLLEPGRRPGEPAHTVVLAAGGYRLRLVSDQLDLLRFEELVGSAGRAHSGGDPATALDLYGEALALWRGPVLADLESRLRQHPAAVAVAGRRLAAAYAYADIAAALGRDRDAAVLLRDVAADEPLQEGLHARLILALARCGQQADALELFAAVRSRLAEALGVEPGPELRDTHVRVLRRNLSAPVPSDPGCDPPPATAPVGVPAQLPGEAVAFTGRARYVRQLDALLAGGLRGPQGEASRAGRAGANTDRIRASVIAVTGMAGVGKTALAVRWAARVRDRFPDGQLYADLRGYAPAPPLLPVEVLARFLRALGVPAEQIPAGVDEASDLYRSLLADRRMLVVLDNARDADQVRPLLPGGSGCLALVTSRVRLSALVVREGARRMTLDVLTPREGAALLARLLGRDRLAAEPGAGAELARACAYLPLALCIAGAKLTNHPYDHIADYLAELREGRLAALEADADAQAAVRAAFELSYSALAPEARCLFRRIGLVPGVDVTARVAAALCDTTVARAARLLDALTAAHLIGEHVRGRYGCHDLLRLYARECCDADDGEGEQRAATDRLLGYYLHTADAAARRLYPDMLRLALPPGGTGADVFANHTEALAWLDAERPNLVAAVRHATEHGPRPVAWLLADALRGYFWARMHTVDWSSVANAALAAAGDEPQARATARLSLGDLAMRQGRYTAAIEHYTRALELSRRTGWRKGEVAVRCNLGVVYWQIGRLAHASEQFTEAHRVNLDTGQLEGQAAVLGNLGLVYREMGRLATAAEHYELALDVDRRIGSRMGEAIDLANVGEACHMRGDLGLALDHLTRALALHREVGDRDTEADTLHRIAAVHRDAGRRADGLELAGAALSLARELGNRRIEVDAANVLASIHLDLGDPRAALDYHQQALVLAREYGNRYPEAQALVGLAACHRHLDDLDGAVDAARQALRITRAAEYQLVQAQALISLAAVRIAGGKGDRAAAYARQALDLARAAGYRLGQAQAHLLLARSVGAAGPARDHERRARALLDGLGAVEADQVRMLFGPG